MGILNVTVTVGSFEQWRTLSRGLIERNVPPGQVRWHDARAADAINHEPLPFVDSGPPLTEPRPAFQVSVPRSFVERARIVACHRDPNRWTLLYSLLWRLTHGERLVWRDPLDADVRALESMAGQVRRDEHKMHAFVRFRKVTEPAGERYVAYHQPDHYIARLAAPFFVERFGAMRWSILTRDECAHWDGETLTFSPGVSVDAAPQEDALEDVWRTYYTAIFNPARVNPRAMLRELPARHWATLPEARSIPKLIAEAPARVDRMLAVPGEATSARPFVPAGATLDELRAAARLCRGCPLHAHATQVVFGTGKADARLMLVGEQPGDEEDVTGNPFVGPAGRVLNDAIDRAGLTRAELYVTNAVKHFTFRREGKRRIHERPRVSDMRACRPWLSAEIERVAPEVILCLGSSAAQSLMGPGIRIQRDRGTPRSSAWARVIMPTYHPSAVLRAADESHSRELFDWLVSDLREAARLAAP